MMQLKKWMQTLCLALVALLSIAEGANLEKFGCSTQLPNCHSDEDYAQCRQPAERSRTGCYCAGGLPRSCADLCDNSSSRDDSGVECRRLCFEYSACLEARWIAAPPAGVVVLNGPSPPLPSKLRVVNSEIPAGSQPPGGWPHSSHLESGSTVESSIARDGDVKAFVMNAFQQWSIPALLVITVAVLIVYGIVKMRYCFDDSRPDPGKLPPKATTIYNSRNTGGDFAYRPLAV